MNDDDLDFIASTISQFDKDNHSHMTAATMCMEDLRMCKVKTRTLLSKILEMNVGNAQFYSRSTFFRNNVPITQDNLEVLIDLLGKRHIVDQYRGEQEATQTWAKETFVKAKELCKKIHRVLHVLDVDTQERREILDRKYLAVVLPARASNYERDAFEMFEYLYFLDVTISVIPSLREVLGKAVQTAWILCTQAHEQDRKIDKPSYYRTVWFHRIHRAYVLEDRDCADKVPLPRHYLVEVSELPSFVSNEEDGHDCGEDDDEEEGKEMARDVGYPWDENGDADLREALDRLVESRCASCKRPSSSDIGDDKLLACSACRCVWYCSQDCQRKHWKSSHKRICKAWRER